MYHKWVTQLLKDNPQYSSASNRSYSEIPHFHVFKKRGKQRIEIMSYSRWRVILDTFFKEAQDAIIRGEMLSLGSRMGYIAGRRVERNHKKKSVNWKKTMAGPVNPETGKRKAVFWTDDDWVRIGWERTVKHKRKTEQYEFDPATGANMQAGAFKQRFSIANTNDPFLKFKYRYFPYITNKTTQPCLSTATLVSTTSLPR